MSARSRARAAENAAQAQYYKALSDIEAIPEIKRVATSNKKDLRDNVGDSLSFRDRRMAGQLDKLGQSINKDDSYKEQVGKFNERYDILKRQLRGETVRKVEVVKNNGNGNQEVIGKNYNSVAEAKAANQGLTFTEPAVFSGIGQDGIGNTNRTGYGSGLINNPQPTYQAVEKEYAFINNGLRHHMGQSQEAYADMQKLASNVKAAPANAAIDQYSTIAAKLKNKVKKEIANAQPATQGQSLVSSELASANPYTETIS
jgi:hypothetical protein